MRQTRDREKGQFVEANQVATGPPDTSYLTAWTSRSEATRCMNSTLFSSLSST